MCWFKSCDALEWFLEHWVDLRTKSGFLKKMVRLLRAERKLAHPNCCHCHGTGHPPMRIPSTGPITNSLLATPCPTTEEKSIYIKLRTVCASIRPNPCINS